MKTMDRLTNRYFLVVDDEDFVRTLVARFLKQSGAAGVIEVANGQQAISAINSYDMTFDAVVTDINMRPMNGLELLSAIRTGRAGPQAKHAGPDADGRCRGGERCGRPRARCRRLRGQTGRSRLLIERVLRVLDRAVTIQEAPARRR